MMRRLYLFAAVLAGLLLLAGLIEHFCCKDRLRLSSTK